MTPVSRFDVVARADPQALMRLLNYFAQIGVLPSRVNAAVTEQAVTVRIEQPGLDEHQARILAEKMQNSVLVETVCLRRGRRFLKPLSETIDKVSS